MASGTLYTYPGNFRAYKVLVAAQYSGAKVKVVSESPDFVLGQTNKSNEFLKKFPLGKVPAFETTDGKYIFESNAIAHFVGNEQLRGKTAVDQAHIVQWVSFADNEVLPSSCAWVFPSISILQPNKQNVERAKEDIKKALTVLDIHLQTKTYLVGERITQADIAVASSLLHLYEHVFEPAVREPLVNVNRWFTTLVNQPQFKAVIGEFKFCTTASQFDAKKYAELHPKDAGSKDKKAAPVVAEKKEKTPKPEKKAAEKEELDETEAILASEPASKDPFEQFPKGTFVVDEFKRVYSNEDTEKVAIPHFWEKFDKEAYSIWHCEYKYPDELTMVFMSCNLISGMYQRLDRMRKHSFGSMILFGEDNKSTISGIWIWRGHDLAFELSPDLKVDYESYNWKKLDPDVDDTKKMVNEYLSWSGDFGGKKFNQGKIFK